MMKYPVAMMKYPVAMTKNPVAMIKYPGDAILYDGEDMNVANDTSREMLLMCSSIAAALLYTWTLGQ